LQDLRVALDDCTQFIHGAAAELTAHSLTDADGVICRDALQLSLADGARDFLRWSSWQRCQVLGFSLTFCSGRSWRTLLSLRSNVKSSANTGTDHTLKSRSTCHTTASRNIKTFALLCNVGSNLFLACLHSLRNTFCQGACRGASQQSRRSSFCDTFCGRSAGNTAKDARCQRLLNTSTANDGADASTNQDLV